MSWTEWRCVEGDGLVFDEIVYEKRTHRLGGGDVWAATAAGGSAATLARARRPQRGR